MLRGKLSKHLGRKLPTEQEILRTLDLVTHFIPCDNPFKLQWATSKRGVVHFRVEASTGNQPWNIDIYGREFFFARVGSYYDTFEAPRRAIDFVRARLRTLHAANHQNLPEAFDEEAE